MQCPLCRGEVRESDILRHVFPDDDWAYRIAILVTHYRHRHISYYDRSWRCPRYASKNPEYADGHEAFKAKVNNRAKRQLIRGIMASKALKDADRVNLIKAIAGMQHNDKETMALRRKMLDKLRHRVNKSFWDSYQPREFDIVTESEHKCIQEREAEAVFGKYKQATLNLQA